MGARLYRKTAASDDIVFPVISVLSGRRHEGLLGVQKPLYPEGVDEIVRFAEEQGLLAASR